VKAANTNINCSNKYAIDSLKAGINYATSSAIEMLIQSQYSTRRPAMRAGPARNEHEGYVVKVHFNSFPGKTFSKAFQSKTLYIFVFPHKSMHQNPS
jgi:hypothetical protein